MTYAGAVQPAAALRILLIAAIYTVIARLGLMLGAVSGFATLVWPPSGIALVALWRSGYRTWPAIAIGAFVVNVWTGAPITAAAGIAVGNTLEAVLGAWLLRRVDFGAALRRVRDVLVLGGLVAMLAPIASATIGVTALALAGTLQEPFAATWVAWWLGDAMGILVVAPMLFAAFGKRAQLARARAIELGLIAVVIASLAALIFSPWEIATPGRRCDSARPVARPRCG
jgi:two-component system, NarL family, sensor histidine kinase FusK